MSAFAHFRSLLSRRSNGRLARAAVAVCEALECRQLLAGNLKVVESTFRYDAYPQPQALVFEFDDSVQATLGTADLTVVNLHTNATIMTAVTFTGGGSVAAFTFPDASGAGLHYLPDGDYRATLSAAGFAGAATGT